MIVSSQRLWTPFVRYLIAALDGRRPRCPVSDRTPRLLRTTRWRNYLDMQSTSRATSLMIRKISRILRTPLADGQATCEVPESQNSLIRFTRPSVSFYEEAMARINKVERHGERIIEKVCIGQRASQTTVNSRGLKPIRQRTGTQRTKRQSLIHCSRQSIGTAGRWEWACDRAPVHTNLSCAVAFGSSKVLRKAQPVVS
jgi:hypothetical protein